VCMCSFTVVVSRIDTVYVMVSTRMLRELFTIVNRPAKTYKTLIYLVFRTFSVLFIF